MRHQNTGSGFAIALIAAAAGSALADPADVAQRTRAITIESKRLGETRELFVRLPHGYPAARTARYPVVYVLDGEWNFDLVAAYLDYYADQSLFATSS